MGLEHGESRQAVERWDHPLQVIVRDREERQLRQRPEVRRKRSRQVVPPEPKLRDVRLTGAGHSVPRAFGPRLSVPAAPVRPGVAVRARVKGEKEAALARRDGGLSGRHG